MLEREKYLTTEEKEIIDTSISIQITELKLNLDDETKFKNKNIMKKIHVMTQEK